jgi:4-hydroxybenzoate polyprenyltransferase
LKILSFFIHSNLLIALAALSLTLASQVQLGMNPKVHPYLAVIFLATLFYYNLHRYQNLKSKSQTIDKDKYKWATEHTSIVSALIISSFAGLVVISFFVRAEILYLLIPLAVLSFLYSFHLPGKQKHNFQLIQLTGMKTLLIALVWTGATVLVPVFFEEQSFDHLQISLLMTERFTFIFAIAIPFDIRDMLADKRSLLKTIPVEFGESTALKISNIALLLSLFIATFHYLDTNMIFILPAYLFSIVSTFIFINNKALKNVTFYHHGILDGSILLHGLFIFMSFYLTL